MGIGAFLIKFMLVNNLCVQENSVFQDGKKKTPLKNELKLKLFLLLVICLNVHFNFHLCIFCKKSTIERNSSDYEAKENYASNFGGMHWSLENNH